MDNTTNQQRARLAADLFGLCECGDRFPDVSALMSHKLRHHSMEWPNVADAVRRLRVNIEVQCGVHGAAYVNVRRDDVETLLGFADKKPNDEMRDGERKTTATTTDQL